MVFAHCQFMKFNTPMQADVCMNQHIMPSHPHPLMNYAALCFHQYSFTQWVSFLLWLSGSCNMEFGTSIFKRFGRQTKEAVCVRSFFSSVFLSSNTAVIDTKCDRKWTTKSSVWCRCANYILLTIPSSMFANEILSRRYTPRQNQKNRSKPFSGNFGHRIFNIDSFPCIPLECGKKWTMCLVFKSRWPFLVQKCEEKNTMKRSHSLSLEKTIRNIRPHTQE